MYTAILCGLIEMWNHTRPFFVFTNSISQISCTDRWRIMICTSPWIGGALLNKHSTASSLARKIVWNIYEIIILKNKGNLHSLEQW